MFPDLDWRLPSVWLPAPRHALWSAVYDCPDVAEGGTARRSAHLWQLLRLRGGGNGPPPAALPGAPVLGTRVPSTRPPPRSNLHCPPESSRTCTRMSFVAHTSHTAVMPFLDQLSCQIPIFCHCHDAKHIDSGYQAGVSLVAYYC